MFKSYYLGEWKTQTDGMPRAGVVPKEIAENNGVSYSLNTYLYWLLIKKKKVPNKMNMAL